MLSGSRVWTGCCLGAGVLGVLLSITASDIITPPSPSHNRMTDGCKNITLLQTSFAGANQRELIIPAESSYPRQRMFRM